MIDGLEGPARAIAAVKRGLKPDAPEIDRIWRTYVGQAKACILTFIEESAQYRKGLTPPKEILGLTFDELLAQSRPLTAEFEAELRALVAGADWRDSDGRPSGARP